MTTTFLKHRREERGLLAFFAAFIVLCLLYRMLLWCALYIQGFDPFGFDPKEVSAVGFWGSFRTSWVGALAATSLYALFNSLLRKGVQFLRPDWPVGWVELVVGDLLLIVSGLIILAHYQLIFDLQSGLTVSLFHFGWTRIGAGDVLSLVDWKHAGVWAVPPLSFHLLRSWLRHVGFAKPLFIVALAGLFGPLLLPSAEKLAPELRFHPFYFFVWDWLKRLPEPPSRYGRRTDLPEATQMKSIKLIDETFVGPPVREATSVAPAAPHRKKWNLIWFVLESVGSEYVFDRSFGNEPPMPFLERITHEGLHLTQHRTASNTSTRALLSLFTGIYPPCEFQDISSDPSVRLPTINRFLGESYHCFLVHPSSESFCFPKPLFVNNGLTELYTRDSIPRGEHADRYPLARNEIDSVTFFLRKLEAAPRPFFAVYWSFIPHVPYSDYGTEDPFQAVRPERRHRYYKNLRVLDEQLERIFVQLKEKHLLEETILVFVGDHGEAFGQHQGYWAHTLGTFDETFKAPVVFYQPEIFPPAEITWNTSHVDILPTLLDAMRIPFNANLLSGESLMRHKPHRKYIFTVSGLGDRLSLISTNLLKVSVSFSEDKAYAYDLTRDPAEMARFPAENYPEQLTALIKFRNFQARIVAAYNAALKNGSEFHGQTFRPGQPSN
jgi:hypothetical protein